MNKDMILKYEDTKDVYLNALMEGIKSCSQHIRQTDKSNWATPTRRNLLREYREAMSEKL